MPLYNTIYSCASSTRILVMPLIKTRVYLID